MRADLQAATRSLRFIQRARCRHHLRRIPPMLGEAETVRVLTPARWRGHQALAVLTDTRLLLVRLSSQRSSTDQ